MHQARRMHDDAAEKFADCLLPEAHAENRPARGDAPAHHVHRLTGIGRTTGSGPDADGVRVRDRALVQALLVVAHDVDPRAERTEEVREVIRERIVVIDEQDGGASRGRLQPSTSRTMRVFAKISSYSASGSLSATMPAEACQYARPPAVATLRRMMHESMSPSKSMCATLPA